MNVLVTGGNGFIGSVVVRRLLELGHRVRCLVRPRAKTDRIAGLDVEKVLGDVRDIEAVRQAVADQSAVIHLASPSSWDVIDSPETCEIVSRGTDNVLTSARLAGACRVVFTSSIVAVGCTDGHSVVDESTPYTLGAVKRLRHSHQKHQMEELCRRAVADGLDVVIVNPAEVYGPNDTGLVTAGNLVDFAKSSPIFVPRGGTSVVHVDDVAAGIVAAMERGQRGQRYILGGENLTLQQLAQLLVSVAGLRTRVITIPNLAFITATRAATLLRLPLPYNPDVVPYATRYWFVDNSKARRELGIAFRPARETLDSTVAWLKQTGRIA
jgi:dihydroflavonol-4-reductase